MNFAMRLTLSWLLLCQVAFAADQAPWEQHGAIRVSSDGHTLQHADGTPFLWLGDTAWGMFQQLTREDVDHYLSHRQALGFTVIQSVAYWYPHGGGMRSGPHNAPNAYGHRPFAGEEDAPDTSKPLVVPGGGPDAPNDYWDHVDYVVRELRRRNLYLALLPCWGRAYITPQFGGAHTEFDEREARVYGEFLGARLRSEPHILWVLGGDAKAQIRGYDHDVFQEYDKRAVFRAMAEGIAYGVTNQRAAWNKPHAAWRELFITYHPDGAFLDNSSKWFHTDAWLTANGIEVWSDLEQIYPTVLGDYVLTQPVKPTLFLEGSYEFGTYRRECGWITPVKQRRQFYHTFFAGGAGFTYGAGPIWAMRGNAGDYNCGYTWKQALDFPGARQFAVIAKAFLKEHEWWQWVPDGRILNGAPSQGESIRAGVVHRSGKSALVYYSNNSHSPIRNVLSGAATTVWFDPRNGQVEVAGTFATNEVRVLAPPSRWEDAILVLRLNP